MGELSASADRAAVLTIHGLGSCVGLCLWDRRTRVAAMAHFMLPTGPAATTPAKFVDTGMPLLLNAFTRAGGSVRRAEAKAAGGASVLALAGRVTDIGRRNIEAVTEVCRQHGIALTASALGGTMARTIELSVEAGTLSVRSAQGSHII